MDLGYPVSLPIIRLDHKGCKHLWGLWICLLNNLLMGYLVKAKETYNTEMFCIYLVWRNCVPFQVRVGTKEKPLRGAWEWGCSRVAGYSFMWARWMLPRGIAPWRLEHFVQNVDEGFFCSFLNLSRLCWEQVLWQKLFSYYDATIKLSEGI